MLTATRLNSFRMTETGKIYNPPAYLLFPPGYEAGARIHSISWAVPTLNSYSIGDFEFDDYVFDHADLLLVTAVGNGGTGNVANTGKFLDLQTVLFVSRSSILSQHLLSCPFQLALRLCAKIVSRLALVKTPTHTLKNGRQDQTTLHFSLLVVQLPMDVVSRTSWPLECGLSQQGLFQTRWENATTPLTLG